jgi:hypothetical protein
MDETNRICPWCSTPIPTTEAACPKCGAIVEGSITREIPGLTVVESKATNPDNDPAQTGPNALPAAQFAGAVGIREGIEPLTAEEEREAVEPPSEAVRIEMRKIELEAEIENAGTEVMSPTGDESIPVGPPSAEAIEAYQAGLLDTTGPAGETNLGELAAPWEDPELEKRVENWQSTTGDEK